MLVALVLLLSSVQGRGGEPATVELQVLFGEEVAGLPVTARLLAAPEAGEPFLRSADVAAAFRLRRGWQPRSRSVVFSSGQRRITARADSRVVTVDTVDTLLRLAPRFSDGELWLPLEFVARVLAPAVGQRVVWEPGRTELRIVTEAPDVVGLSIHTGPRRTVLRLRARRRLRWRVDSPARGVLRLTADGAALDAAAVTRTRQTGLVLSVTPRPDPSRAVVDVAFSPLVSTYRTSSDDRGRTLVVTLLEEENGAVPLPEARGSRSAPAMARETARPVGTVVIDAGHGGDDPGAVVGDTAEKDVVLEVARELYRRLRREGLEVVLTRDADTAIGDEQRAALADWAGGDLFLSLHADWWPDPARNGVTVRILRPLSGGGESGDLFVRWEQVQQPYLERSAELAGAVVDALAAAGRPTQGVRRADLPLLRGIDMPAVLVELGYLSSPGDRRVLTREGGRRRLADALAEAVLAVARRWQPEAEQEVPR